jgi:RNA 2',3'-cyclic 3'-phosphodiesterase
MPAQSSLPGFDAEPKPTDRLFFAIFPDADTAARIARLALQLRSEHGLRGTPLKQERFHVTLHHLGDYAGLNHGIVAMATMP